MRLLESDAQRHAFAEGLRGGRLHHAWLLAGPRGIGKARFAQAAGAALLDGHDADWDDPDTTTGRLIAAGSHPDYKAVVREVWDKASPPRIVPANLRKPDDLPARSIRIAQIRALTPLLALSPSLGSRRAVVIDAVDDLEPPAANALLKMLEEPPAGTVFLLVSHAPGRLLPTIRSRCRLLRFSPLSEGAIAEILAEQRGAMGADDRRLAAAMGEGSAGRALDFADAGSSDFEATLDRIARKGDRDNHERSTLARGLSTKAAADRYRAFTERVPRYIAAAAREATGDRMRVAIERWEAASRLSADAVAQSLPPDQVVFELAGHVAALAGRGGPAKA